MYVRHPQNTLHILELCNIHFLAPTAVKHTFLIDPNRIAVQNCHMFTIIMFVFRHSASTTSFSSIPTCSPGFGSDVANIFIPMNISPLPSLGICHDHWTLAGQTTWQHLFTCLPATIYCPSVVGKHLWASSLGTTIPLFCKLALRSG